MKYGTTYVEEKYSSILEPNLFADQVFIPGMTYNAEKQVNAGKVYIFKETKRSTLPGPQTPAGNFTDRATANSLIPITLNNAFRDSKAIYQVSANSLPYDLAETNLSLAVNEIREDRQYSALACLAAEGTDMSDTAAITASNVKAKILAARTMAKKQFANPDVVLCSVDTFAAVLEAAGSQFTPVMNDRINESANVGKWLGMTFVECNGIQGTGNSYYNAAGTLTSKDLDDVDFILYDHNALHIVDNLEVMRVIDSENFAGVKAQVEINSGITVSDEDKVIVKFNS